MAFHRGVQLPPLRAGRQIQLSIQGENLEVVAVHARRPCTPFGVLPSATVLVCGEMFQAIQCVNSPLGASGSSTINTRVFASARMPEICKAGLVFAPSHVNFDGMLPPCWKAELVIFILAPPAANVAIAASKIADAPARIAFCIDRPSVEIAVNRQT